MTGKAKKITTTVFCLAISMSVHLAVYGQSVVEADDTGRFADAHIHQGLSFNKSHEAKFDVAYASSRHVRYMAYPMPANSKQTDDLVSILSREIEALRVLARHSADFRIMDSDHDSVKCAGEEKVTLFLGIEYFSGVFAGRPENVDAYRKLDIRSITIIDNEVDRFFIDNELTSFGLETILRMNELGILVDMAHLSEKQMISVANASSRPVIVSHTCVRAISRNSGCMSDQVLEAIKANGGYVFATFNRGDLLTKDEPDADGISRVIDNIVYMVSKLGAEKVGIGSDFQANGLYVPKTLNQSDTYSLIMRGLAKTGMTDAEVAFIGSGSFLNAMNVDLEMNKNQSPIPGQRSHRSGISAAESSPSRVYQLGAQNRRMTIGY